MQYNHILLIDDDADDRDIFETALSHISRQVKYASFSSALEALAQLRAGHRADVIFLDLNMPLMNGMEFLAEIKKDVNLQHIPIIVFSTSGSVRCVEQSLSLGAKDHITKPYEIAQLVRILEKLI